MRADVPIPELDAKGLRQFAVMMSAVVPALFGLLLPWVLGHGLPAWPWVFAGVFLAWGLAAPSTLRPVYRGWMRFGLILHRVVSPVVLAVIFYLVFTPCGIVMRLLRHDPMARARDRSADSYRIPSEKRARDSMERPY